MRGPECGGVGRWCFERNLNQTLLFLHKTTVSTYPPLPRLYSPATRAESVVQSQHRVWPEWLGRPPIGCRGGNWSSAANESRQSRCKAKNQFPANCGWMITKGETITGRTWCKFQHNGSHNVYKLHGANFSTFLHGPYWLVILLRICSNNWN